MKLLAPLSGLFGGAVALRNRLYDQGTIRTERLARPVVSIGNLRVGGAGKTPFTLHLGKLLQARGIAFDILSRGYRRESKSIRLVEESGTAREFGDEPLLLARKLGVPVIVGADRVAAGRHAEALFADLKPAHSGLWLHLLDDGFQHRRLARDFDIVLITPTDARDSLLPAGRLREPLSALRRADAVVLTENISTDELPLEKQHVWRVTRRLDLGPEPPPEPALAFCGIARPQRFFDDLRAAGIELADAVAFPDHFHYTADDITRLLRRRDEFSAKVLLCTEKDEVNLRSAGLWERLAPVRAVPLQMELIDPQRALDTILGVVANRSACR